MVADGRRDGNQCRTGSGMAGFGRAAIAWGGRHLAGSRLIGLPIPDIQLENRSRVGKGCWTRWRHSGMSACGRLNYVDRQPPARRTLDAAFHHRTMKMSYLT
jgi:hypothetical protein